MDDEITVAETVAGAAEKIGLRKYLWLYFFVVPLAAATASCVAIAIAALQGLSAHPLAMQIYAATVLACSKTVLVFGCSYAIGVLLAMITSRLRTPKTTKREAQLQASIGALPNGLKKTIFTYLYSPWNRSEGQMLQMSVAYAAFTCILGLLAFVRPEIVAVYQFLEQIAALPPPPCSSQPLGSTGFVGATDQRVGRQPSLWNTHSSANARRTN